MTAASLLIDGHVHFHPCFELEGFLDGAADHFANAGGKLAPSPALGCLLFSESAWYDYFQQFADGLIARTTRRWSTRSTGEAGSLLATRDGQPRLVLAAGRQVVTAENLEVLALGCTDHFDDGQPIEKVLETALARGAITVVPWGFGKWWGRRGRVVQRLLESPHAERLHLGDNAGRPAHSPAPHFFEWARRRGVPVLPGSDPLPFAWQGAFAGRYGFVLNGIDPHRPVHSIKAALEANRTQPAIFGQRQNVVVFVRSQVGMQLRKAVGGRSGGGSGGGSRAAGGQTS